MQWEKLLQPGYIGTMQVRNRIVMPGMGARFAEKDGTVSNRTKAYYEARAAGGTGLVIVEVAAVDRSLGVAFKRQLGIDDDRYLAGLSELTTLIKKHGARAGVQLHHAGNAAHTDPGIQPVAPSVVTRDGYEQPRELSIAEIGEVVQRFARGAARAKKAGFDGVEIHAAHLYLVAQFLSQAWNKRTDAYGGSLQNRARFLLEIISAVRQKVGRDYPVWCRINGAEYGIAGGTTVQESKDLAPMLEEAGADAIHVSAMGYHRYALTVNPEIAGAHLPLAEAVKKVVHIPVIAVGRIGPVLAETTLKEGKADFITMGRPVLADPELANKLASGKADDIRPCIYCNDCVQRFLKCTVNPLLGREFDFVAPEPKQRKKVIVVGGGPAGMEAALVAARRGHDVSLYEKTSRLGGKLNLACLPPRKERYRPLIQYMTEQLAKLGVKVELGKEPSPDILRSARPSTLVVATGATSFIPEIPGLKNGSAVLAEDVVQAKVDVGENVIIVGGELVGCEVANFLADKGKQVAVIQSKERMMEAKKEHLFARAALLGELREKGVKLLAGSQLERVSGGEAIIKRGNGTTAIKADTIVFALEPVPNENGLAGLESLVPEVYRIGDCSEPHGIQQAIHDGFWAAGNI